MPPKLSLSSFRALYHALEDGKAPVEQLLEAALQQLPKYIEGLEKDRVPGAPQPNSHQLSLWYAASRVNDLLLVPLQNHISFPNRPEIPQYRNHVELTEDTYRHWWEALGFAVAQQSNYHPFWHELVQIIEDEALAVPVQIERVFWPVLTFGQLLFSRAGVQVRTQPGFFVKEQAENYRLFQTFHRVWRPTDDLSIGWGHNSQWATDFRRDYATETGYWFNADGPCDLTSGTLPLVGDDGDSYCDDDLTYAEHVELLVNRCLVRTPKPDKDYSIFDCRLFVRYENAERLR
ncbi:hypothetical protein [Armatimonas sp.]|uniref:hypothetical protein n=1 Tax=Armatimonas sp. TaxID=1872638 RepID=UPI00374DC1D4